MGNKKIGWIGTGVMGLSMCRRLQQEGYQLYVFSRTKERSRPLLDNGAVWCESPGDIGKECRLVFTMVGYPADVEEVILGPEGVLSSMSGDSILVDFTTSRPELAERIFNKGQEQGIAVIDAPVSGGDIGAKEGTLAIMAGGEETAFNQVLPILNLLGRNIRLMGPAGSGQHTKMSNQILIASTMIGVVEALLYAQKAGLDQQEVISIIGQGAASSWSINVLGPRIVKGDFNPGFYIKHFIKDMGIAIDEAHRMGINLPGLNLVYDFYKEASHMGLDDMGTQGLYKVLEKLNQ